MLRFLRNLLAKHLYALAIGGSVLLFAAARHHGWPAEGLVIGWGVLVLALSVALERLMPFERAWREPDGDAAVDTASALVLVGVIDPLLKAGIPVFALWALKAAGANANSNWVLDGLPFAAQVLLALLWIEFAKYGSHRLHHELRSLWWLHALHHSSRRLYWLNNFRLHPLNHAINMAVSLLPLWLVGTPLVVMLAATAVTLPVLVLQHANIDLRSGWLNWVFSTNELHRWHHSRLPAEANSNFGSALVIWDQVFGTYKPVPARRTLVTVGLFGNGAGYPAMRPYLAQIASMFSPNCCKG